MLRSRKLRTRAPARIGIVLGVLGVVVAGSAALGGAASPPTQEITVPAAGAPDETITWTGTIAAPDAHPTSDCNDPGLPPDVEDIKINAQANG